MKLDSIVIASSFQLFGRTHGGSTEKIAAREDELNEMFARSELSGLQTYEVVCLLTAILARAEVNAREQCGLPGTSLAAATEAISHAAAELAEEIKEREETN